MSRIRRRSLPSSFQSTLPRGERPTTSSHARVAGTSFMSGFNPRSHGGSDANAGSGIRSWDAFKVSIHAPTGGATWARPPGYYAETVSIHAPTGGATGCLTDGTLLKFRCFNPRSHGGSDAHRAYRRAICGRFQSTLPRGERRAAQMTGSAHKFVRVSIHAPTGGATRIFPGVCARGSRFNPRSHGGSDGVRLPNVPIARPFQSTLPRGERLIGGNLENSSEDAVSIHAPTGGAT